MMKKLFSFACTVNLAFIITLAFPKTLASSYADREAIEGLEPPPVSALYAKMPEADVDERLNDQLGSQVFGIPTFDSTFKHVMSDPKVLLEFIQVFSEQPDIVSVERLDDALNPIREHTKARKVLSSASYESFMKSVRSVPRENVYVAMSPSASRTKKKSEGSSAAGERVESPVGADFLWDLSQVYSDIKGHFPEPDRDSRMDLVCKLSDGNYALVEVQVATQDYWNKRALAYAAAFYGNQLKRGGQWEDLKSVIAINLLGKGQRESNPWADYPEESVRHFVFTDKLNKREHTIDELQLIQYCVPHLMKKASESPQWREWAEFFQTAQDKTEEDIKGITSEAVRRAYELARVRAMPLEFKRAYLTDYTTYGGYAKHLAAEVLKGRIQGRAEGRSEGILQSAANIINRKRPKLEALDISARQEKLRTIAQDTGLDFDVIELLWERKPEEALARSCKAAADSAESSVTEHCPSARATAASSPLREELASPDPDTARGLEVPPAKRRRNESKTAREADPDLIG